MYNITKLSHYIIVCVYKNTSLVMDIKYIVVNCLIFLRIVPNQNMDNSVVAKHGRRVGNGRNPGK